MFKIVALVVIGLAFGSFVNALVWRLHERGQAKNKLRLKELSITRGRSMCPDCHHTLGWQDLIPVFSWLLLGGKCRYCKKPISSQYPLVELLTAALFVVSYLSWSNLDQPHSWLMFLAWLPLLTVLVALFLYDLKWMLLPNSLVAWAFGLSLVQFALKFGFADQQISLITQAILAIFVLGGLFYLLFIISDGKWIGGGDVKLGVVLGLIVGRPLLAAGVLFLASLLGTVYSLPQLIDHKLKTSSKIPFGPFLIIATVVIYLFGTSLQNWLRRHLFLV